MITYIILTKNWSIWGKYAYENGELDKAFEIWQKIVKIKAVSYRYFEYDDPKYKEFYKSRK